MKAVTLRQPWASLIAEGAKWIETRDWRCTSLIGTTVGIHAGRHAPAGPDYDPGARPRVGDWAIERLREPTGIEWAMEHATNIPGVVTRIGLPLGALVATATVVDCVPTDAILIHSVGGTYPRREYSGGGPRPYCHRQDQAHAWAIERKLDEAATLSLALVDHAQVPFGDFSPGRWGWLLADIVKLDEPIECRGMPGIWPVPPEVEARLA